MVAGFLAGYLKTQDYEQALKLGIACGSATAFMEGLADFSKMSTRRLHIGQAVQKTAIELSPTGTKAAAATGVGMEDECESPSVLLNRPFVYMILDNKTNLPLFIGVMTEMT